MILCEEVDCLTAGSRESDYRKLPQFIYEEMFDGKNLEIQESAPGSCADEDDSKSEGSLHKSKKNHRILLCAKSAAVYSSYLGLGLAACVIGPTMVPLEGLLSTDTHTFSFTFTGTGVGYVLGAILCGATFERFKKEVQFTLAILLVAASTAAAPFAGVIYGYIALMTLQSIGMGFIDTGANVYALDLWTGLSAQDPLMQALHCVWCIGAIIGPFIIHPFISSPPDMDINTTSTAHPPQVHSVQYSYVVLAFIILTTSVIFAILSFLAPSSKSTTKSDSSPDKDTSAARVTITRRHKVILLVMLFTYSAFYYSLECTTSNFAAAFAIKHLSWDVTTGAATTSTYWAGLGLGRFTNIFVSVFLNPTQMLLINMTLITSSFILLLFTHLHSSLLWVGVALAGYGMSSTFVTIVLWASRHMPITGAVTAVFIVGASVGCTSLAPLIGLLFQKLSPLSLVYVNLTVSLLLFLLSGCLWWYEKPRMKPSSTTLETEVEQSELKALNT